MAAAVYRITKFMIPLYHRCTEVDMPISYDPKIYNERQEISCRRDDRLVPPSWFVADLTVAEMACRRDDRKPRIIESCRCRYMLCADYEDYIRVQEEVGQTYLVRILTRDCK